MPAARERLPIQPWMEDPATQAVFAALEAAGGPDCARFVGGCVRNALIGRPVDDIDVCTTLEPSQVIAALKAARLKSVPTGVEHGTVTAISGGRPFEVTTLRRDVETDGRRAVVAFTTDWGEDARRRDFRLNALYMDGAGRLYDPTGCGIEDALAGRVAFVGDPQARIREDYLRILRFFRFNAWYGRGEPDAAGLAACAALKDGMAQLSAERVSKELLKLLSAEDPSRAVALMAETGVLAAVAAGFENLPRLQRLVAIERAERLGGDAELRLAALWTDGPQDLMREADRLRLSRAQRERLGRTATREPSLTAGLSLPAARRLFYRWGPITASDRIKLAWAAAPSAEHAHWRALLSEAECWRSPRFPLTGQDLSEAGVRPGPAMGRILRAVEAWWVERDFAPDRDALLEQARTLLTSM